MGELPKKKAVVVGVGRVGADVGALTGTLNDVTSVKNTLIDVYRMAPEDIVMMYDDYDVETDKRKSYYPT
jgi:hypothetical protein